MVILIVDKTLMSLWPVAGILLVRYGPQLLSPRRQDLIEFANMTTPVPWVTGAIGSCRLPTLFITFQTMSNETP
jgi:hypothetical protein